MRADHTPLFSPCCTVVLCGSIQSLSCSDLCAIVGAPILLLTEGAYHGQICIGVLNAYLMQLGSDPCKIPNLSHLLWIYGAYFYMYLRDMLYNAAPESYSTI